MPLMWESVARATLAAWVGAQQTAAPPPDFPVVTPVEVVELPPGAEAFARFAKTTGWRAESGAVELDLSDWPLPPPAFNALPAWLAAVDGREFVREDPAGTRGVSLLELRSLIDGMPVIGAGGRMTVFRVGSRVAADVVIRRRGPGRVGQWREPGEVLTRLDAVLGGDPEIVVRPALGYFEASKYERQDWLRLVYAFVVEREAASRTPGWRTTLLEPAVQHGDVPLWAGLEPWAPHV